MKIPKKLVGAVAVAVEQTNHEGLFNGDDALDVLADYLQCLLYDPEADNFFVGFSNTGWAWIDAAFDVKHGTVGYMNYTPTKVGGFWEHEVVFRMLYQYSEYLTYRTSFSYQG